MRQRGDRHGSAAPVVGLVSLAACQPSNVPYPICGNALFEEAGVEVTLHLGEDPPARIELPFEFDTSKGHCNLTTEAGEVPAIEPSGGDPHHWRRVELRCGEDGTEILQALHCRQAGTSGELQVCEADGHCRRFVVHCYDR